jgi:hypothetical protein
MLKRVIWVTRRKLSSLATFFIYEVSGEVMVKFHQKNLFYTGMYDLPEMLIRRPVEFLTVVTHKLLTVLSRLMYHRKAERVVVQNGIRDFQSFGQSETEN